MSGRDAARGPAGARVRRRGRSGRVRGGPGLRGLDEVADLLERYLAELDRWNARFGFVKATADELVAKHALDSIAGAATVADLCAEVRSAA